MGLSGPRLRLGESRLDCDKNAFLNVERVFQRAKVLRLPLITCKTIPTRPHRGCTPVSRG